MKVDLFSKVHNLKLENHGCNIFIVIKIIKQKYCVVTNKGRHSHGKPPAIHATQYEQQRLREWVENNPGDKPINIVTDTP